MSKNPATLSVVDFVVKIILALMKFQSRLLNVRNRTEIFLKKGRFNL